jgi:ABC-2 type transport system permease protein
MFRHLLVLANEIHKGLLHVWRYKVNLLAQLAMFSFLFVGIGFLMGRGRMDLAALPSMLVGFVVWYYAFMAILSMSASLATEAQTGTLEQAYISQAPPEWIFVGRALSTFVSTSLMGAVMVGALVLVFGLRLPVSLAALPVFVMTLAGVFGFGFMIGGATLAFKRVDAVGNLVQNMLLFMNGTLLPVDQFPGWMAAVANTLPTTLGISALRAVTIERRPLSPLWHDGTLGTLALHSAAYLAAGWLIFRWCERYARRRGTLGHY